MNKLTAVEEQMNCTTSVKTLLCEPIPPTLQNEEQRQTRWTIRKSILTGVRFADIITLHNMLLLNSALPLSACLRKDVFLGLPVCEKNDNPSSDSSAKVRKSDRLRLEDGALTLEVAPACGGCITQFFLTTDNRRINLFRRADETAIEGPLPLGAACFPMVPYAGRLRDGTYQHNLRQVNFSLDAFCEPHSSHGDGWMRPWQVLRHSRRLAVLMLKPIADSSFRYRCRQVISLDGTCLRVRMRIWNDEAVAMPVGIGLHPYFPLDGDPILTAKLPQSLALDEELMPIGLKKNERAQTLAEGVAISTLPAQCEFWGWDGKALVNWPTEGISLNIRTEPGLRGAVLWVPSGKNFFCFEPVSHSTDAFNLDLPAAINHGVIILEPNAQYMQDFFFDLR